jgi:parallel beta-helix repeat protein
MASFLSDIADWRLAKKSPRRAVILPFVLVLMLVLGVILPSVMTIYADASAVETSALIKALPNPVGVGQMVQINMTISPRPPTSTDRFIGLVVTITHPDRSIQTLGPFDSDVNGSCLAYYSPNTVGNYTLTLSYPGQPFSYGKITYQPATNNTFLIVQLPPPRTWIVNATGSGDFSSIQAAINAASAGDIINVRNGRYYEHVVVNKSLNLIGQNMSQTIIDGSSIGNVLSVTASNVTVSGFTILNSSVNGGSGVYLSGSTIAGNISGNIIINNGYGLYLNSSSRNTLSSNYISNSNYFGIYLFTSSNNGVSSNSVSNSVLEGICLNSSLSNIVSSNNIVGGIYGVDLFFSSNNTVSINDVANAQYGVNIFYSSNNIISANRLRNNTQNGLRLYGSSNNTLSGNSATACGENAIVLTLSMSNAISGNNITQNPNGYGINLVGSSFNTISNNTLANNGGGIMFSSSDSTPSGNYSSNNIVSGNIVSSNSFIGIAFWYSSNNLITNNTLSANTFFGMYICASPGNTISNNSVTTSGNEKGRGGIDIYGSANNIVSRNYVANNFDGINVDYGSTNTTVVENNIRYNAIGIYIFNILNSHDNIIYHNNLVNNVQQVSIDNTPNISWDNGYPSGGNFWSDYNGTDANHNGIGDIPYFIDQNNRDNYPLMQTYTLTKTWIVDDNGPSDFQTIQAAVNAANIGDTIYVKNGTYTENIVVNKRLTLIGENQVAVNIDQRSFSMGTALEVAATANGTSVSGFKISGFRQIGFSIFASYVNISGNLIEAFAPQSPVGGGSVVAVGIWLQESASFNTISSNSITVVMSGVLTTSNSVNNTISGNKITPGKDGTALVLQNTVYNTVKGNNFQVNGTYGISLSNCNSTRVTGNFLSGNFSGAAVFFGNSRNNLIDGNNVTATGYSSIFLTGASFNSFYHNNFMGSALPSIVLSSNTWDNGYPSGGNFWSNYNGMDANHDGIGDTQYFLDTNNIDRYPLIAPWMVIQSSNGPTFVSGTINSNTTWFSVGSPYKLVGNIFVNIGVTLTIEPGTIVNLADFYIKVNGTLYARGTANNKIVFMSNGTGLTGLSVPYNGVILFSSESSGWNEQTKSGCIVENAIINSTQGIPTINVGNSSTKINNNIITNAGGQRAIWINGGAPIISNNTISSDNEGITINLGPCNALISNNIISGCQVGIEVYGGTAIIERNLIINNNGNKINGNGGIRIDYAGTSPLIGNNTIANNSVGINLIRSPSPVIILNNIQNNTDYNVYLNTGTSATINAPYNWWGSTNASDISRAIYDFKNDFNLGNVSFVPFLTSPNYVAPAYPTSPWNIQTTISLSLKNNPIGVGQKARMNMLISPPAPSYNDVFNVVMLNVTRPDGTVQILGPYSIPPNGSRYDYYTPTQVGNYTLQLFYSGQFFSSSNVTYLGAQSPKTTLFVQSQPVSTTWIVDDDGPADFCFINWAINDANPGDTIIVNPGIYTETVVLSKMLYLRGVNYPVVDAQRFGSCITIAAPNCTVEGFKVTNSLSSANEGGIKVQFESGGNNIIRNNIAYNNSFHGLYIAKTSNNSIVDNTVFSNYRGMEFWVEEGDYIANNTVYSNNEIGILIGDCSRITLENNRVLSQPYESGIMLDGCDNSSVKGNFVAGNLFGITLDYSGRGNRITSNNITSNGWGFRWFSQIGGNFIYHNNFRGNTVQAHWFDILANDSAINYWDNGYPSGGNYWSNYNGTDGNNDGIGDTSYNISPSNVDHYPLRTSWSTQNLVLANVTLLSGGSGYTTPAILLVGGGGVGATATARVSNGVIYAITITNPGYGYTSLPTIIIRDPSPRANGASATINSIVTP